MSSDSRNGRSFLTEALPLMASYLFGSAVELGAMEIGVDAGHENQDETDRFLSELAARHNIASAFRLQSLIPKVERQPSLSSNFTSHESEILDIDRLDLSKYIARSAQGRAERHRTYPLLVLEETPDTPENALVVQALRSISRQMARSPFPSDTSEGIANANLYHWSRSRLRRLPWSRVRNLDSISRLKHQTERRIRKRQTGNDSAYLALLSWIQEWEVDPIHLGAETAESIVDGILAFPVGGFFWEKVFEVWTLQQVLRSLERVGLTRTEGPEPIHLRNLGPIARFSRYGMQVEVWFQRQKPLGAARWTYSATGHGLAGIPDVVAASPTGTPLVVDAKYRLWLTPTRSEETYKMLGYAENFHDLGRLSAFAGLLLFPGDISSTTLTSEEGGRLTLLGIDPTSVYRHEFERLLDQEITSWIATIDARD